ncbi:ATP-binding protein [candidate division WOR-3 bacterium]|nr:ATP-binding protein [candidate division WOR-3 bacterium]
MEPAKGSDIGYVIEVNGERAFVELHADTTTPLAGDYLPGQPGSHVKIPVQDRYVIGTVTSISLKGRNLASAACDPSTPPTGHKVADCMLMGTMGADGRFVRGVAAYPNVGQQVKVVSADELKRIFSEFGEYGFSFGRPVQAEDQRAFVNVDRFFGQHVAVVGATGCGKSCTVASILQQVNRQYPDTHVVVLDLHGEYAAAFPEQANLITADQVELPYWLLSFDEFQDLTVDMNEFSAKNQLTVLRDAMTHARQETVGAERIRQGECVTADSPVFFRLEDMLETIRGWNIQMTTADDGVSLRPGPLYGEFDRFLLRLDSKISDPRYKFMFASKTYQDNESLAPLLRHLLTIDTGRKMTIVDLSGIPSEAVGVVAAVVSRVVFEFNFWNPERERFPILLVYEEAHNYVPSRAEYRLQAAKAAIERITKEGRKYGIGTIVVSQRPKELSETVLSQCNSFIAMRLTNPDDQAYVRRLVPDSLSGLLNMLPSLRTGEALILGDCVAMPTRAMIDCPKPKPKSSGVEFAKWWTCGVKDLDIARVVKRWRTRHQNL